MAIDNQFGKGIGLAAGFDLGAQKPLDSRVAVNTIAERDAHITENRAYEGMIVYVAENNMTYQLVKDAENEGQLIFKEFGFNKADFDESFEGAIEEVDERLKDVEESLAQGGAIENRIANAESDIDGLQGLVGQPANGDNEASGLHAAVDAAQAKADQGVADAAAEKQRAEGQEAAIRQELANAVSDLQAEIDSDVLAEKNRALGQEAAIRQELANEKAALQAEIDADVKVEKERAEGKEAELLAAINKEVEDRGNAVQDLANRHDQEMEAVEGRVTALENLHKGENSVENQIANAKKEVLNAVNTEKGRAEGQEAAIRQELANEKKALQDEIDADVKVVADNLDDEIARADAKEKALEQAIDNEKNRAEGKEAELLQAINDEATRADAAEKANKAVIDVLNGAVDVEGSVKKQIKDAVDAVNADADALEARVKVNEEKLAVVQGADNVEGSIAKAKKDAKAYADQQIAALVDSAPEAMNTLRELASAINSNKGIYDAYIEAHATDMANAIKDALTNAANTAAQKDAALKAELQQEIDDDVAAEAALRSAADQALQAAINAVQADVDKNEADCDAAIKAEKERAMAEEADIRADFAAADAALKTELQAEIDADVKVVADDLAGEKGRAKNEEAAIRKEFANADSSLKTSLQVEIKDTVDEEIEARKAADQALEGKITKEVTDRNQAIADALVPYSTTEQMKALVGNVVNSLALSMVNNEMVLKLGGVDGIALTSTDLDMVTDDDIDAIIAGLDQE